MWGQGLRWQDLGIRLRFRFHRKADRLPNQQRGRRARRYMPLPESDSPRVCSP
jgi:hypothetical protein